MAKLAGIPAAVLAAAQEKLTELEQSDKLKPTPVSPPQPSPQSDLFSTIETHPVVDMLESMEIDDLSPREALQKLYEMKTIMD